MSIVIVGGNEGMAAQYETICREHGCRARVYTYIQRKTDL